MPLSVTTSQETSTEREQGNGRVGEPGDPARTARPGGGVPASLDALDAEGTDVAAGVSAALALVVWTSLVVAAIWWGPDLLTEDAKLGAPPFMGRWLWGISPSVVAPLALAAATVAYGPRLAATLHWRTLLFGAGASTVAWSVALAAVDGWRRVSHPMRSRHEYPAVVDRIEGPGSFLQTFIERLDTYPTHVQGHPPGMPLLLWLMDRLGMGGTGWATALVLAGGGLVTGATLVAVKSVVGSDGEQVARRAAPFLAVAPAALWLGTSADALFAGVIALAIALIVSNRSAAQVAGGVVLGLALFLTYGTVPLLVIPVGVWLYRRNLVPLLWAAAGVAAVLLAFWAGGFWWFDGLDATREIYHAETSVQQHRPYSAFVWFLNPAAFAVAVGPAVVVAMSVWARQLWKVPAAVWLLPALGFVAVGGADVSGLSKGEVERIWLPFAPWILLLTALLPRARARLWLAVQVSVAIILQLSLHSLW